MNERIKELAKQADPDYTGIHDDDMGHALVGEEAINKFALLIVEECAYIAKHHVMNISTYADAEFVEEKIEQHFGVE